MEDPQQRPGPSGSAAGGVAGAVTSALQGLVSKPDLFLIRAAQASALKQLKAARTQLRDFNAAAKQQLEEQITAVDAAVQHLLSIRQDLDQTFACIRSVKQQLAEHHPDLHQQLLQQLSEAQD